MSFNSVQEVLELLIGWENKLLACYEGIYDQLKSERTALALEYLVKEQRKTVAALAQLNLEDYEKSEFMKFIPDYKSEAIIPHIDISEFSSAEELLSSVLVYEEKLNEFYGRLYEIASYEKSKDLFEMLRNFKLTQVKNIKSVLDGWDLSA